MAELTDEQKRKVREAWAKPYVEPLGYIPKELRKELAKQGTADKKKAKGKK